MDSLHFLHLILLLCASQLHGLEFQSPHCVNDYVNIIICVWNSTGLKPDTSCTIHGHFWGLDSMCSLVPVKDFKQSLKRCHMVFQRSEFTRISEIEIEVRCENYTNPVVRMETYKPLDHIKLHPPSLPVIEGTRISWNLSSPVPVSLEEYQYELQYKRIQPCCGDAEIVKSITQSWLDIPETYLAMGALYEVKVRAKPSGDTGEWSDWSPAATWKSTEGIMLPSHIGLRAHSLDQQELGLSSLIVIPVFGFCLLFAYIYKSYSHSWIYKIKKVPDPSKFFSGMSGNFQKWLDPMFAPECYTLQHSDLISPVEVFSRDGNALLKRTSWSSEEHWDNSEQSSSFSNMGYFCSRYQSSYEAEPCHIYFSYKPTGSSVQENKEPQDAQSIPIQVCSSYEQVNNLVKPQNLEDHGEPKEHGEASNEKCDTHNHALVIPLPSCPGLTNLESQANFLQLPLPIPGFDFMTAFGLTSGTHDDALLKSLSMSIEPCSDDYMPVKSTETNSSNRTI